MKSIPICRWPPVNSTCVRVQSICPPPQGENQPTHNEVQHDLLDVEVQTFLGISYYEHY